MFVWILSEFMLLFSMLIILDQLLVRVGIEDDDIVVVMCKELLVFLVIWEDKIVCCVCFDVEFVQFDLGEELVQVLIYQKINGYDYGDFVIIVIENFIKLVCEMGYGVLVSVKGSVFMLDNLIEFDVVIWNNVSGDMLMLLQCKVFEDYMNNGGGFLGIYVFGGDFVYFWDWYCDVLVGVQFIGYLLGDNWFQDVVLDVMYYDMGVVEGILLCWVFNDEWYFFLDSVFGKGYDIVMLIDESIYMFGKELEMGEDYLLVWIYCVGKGRVMYSVIGYCKEVYNVLYNIMLLKNGMKWVFGQGNDICKQVICVLRMCGK